MAIIGISGKIGAGKDLTGKIIQILTSFPNMSTERVLEHIDKDLANNKFEIKKFADKLKDIVCILIGCTKEQLEDREFKEKELGEEWYKYLMPDFIDHQTPTYFGSLFKAKRYVAKPYWNEIKLVKLTPRLLLQLIGTDCGRNIIHPNIWVNSLMNKYKDKFGAMDIMDTKTMNIKRVYEQKESNWIITDVRFPNEFHAIKQKGGLTIRVEKDSEIIATHQAFMQDNKGEYIKSISIECHPSKTALDDVEFDYIINNNGSIEVLINRVRTILSIEGII